MKTIKVKSKFKLGSRVKDIITGFEGIVVARSQWLNNCSTYGVQPEELKNGIPQEKQWFDEPQLELVKTKVFKANATTGGPQRSVPNINR